ncbi:MAG: hypothetical protein H6825_07205 [Planctomycetes bacterium]|nr:hypothetical protein [Planctomycetota bacterium]
MIRPRIQAFVLSCTALVGVAAGTLTLSSTPGVDAGSLSAGGSAAGTWDLPKTLAPEHDGTAYGLLELGGGFPFYLLDAVLPAASADGIGVGSSGTLYGTLWSFPLSPIGPAAFAVTGTWTAKSPDGGVFTAFVHLAGPPSGLPIHPLGVIRGTFSDLVAAGGPDVLGSFEADWVIFSVL